MTEDRVLYHADRDVAVIQFNRPDSMNSLTWPMLETMAAHLERANSDDTIGAIALPSIVTSVS